MQRGEQRVDTLLADLGDIDWLVVVALKVGEDLEVPVGLATGSGARGGTVQALGDGEARKEGEDEDRDGDKRSLRGAHDLIDARRTCELPERRLDVSCEGRGGGTWRGGTWRRPFASRELVCCADGGLALGSRGSAGATNRREDALRPGHSQAPGAAAPGDPASSPRHTRAVPSHRRRRQPARRGRPSPGRVLPTRPHEWRARLVTDVAHSAGAPTTTVGGVPAGWTNQPVTVTLTATDESSSIVSIEYQLRGRSHLDHLHGPVRRGR